VKRSFSEQAVVAAIQDTTLTSVSAILKRLGKSPFGGGSHALIRRIATKYGLPTSHWLGQGWAKGKKRPEYVKNAVESLHRRQGAKIRGSDIIPRLIRDGVKKHQCEECKQKTWNKQPIALEIHHVDGDAKNNQIENIKLLCPNCHAQTPNYGGRNKRVVRET